MKRTYLVFITTLSTIIIVDWLTKAWILNNLRYRDGFTVINGFFDIVHARNRGAAFGLFNSGDPSWVLPFFLVVGTIALGFLLSLLRKVPEQRVLLPVLLGAIGGGAVGNMIDRVRFGYVVDFLDFYIGSSHWPAFNVADMGISGGVSVLLVLSLLKKDDELFSAPTTPPEVSD